MSDSEIHPSVPNLVNVLISDEKLLSSYSQFMDELNCSITDKWSWKRLMKKDDVEPYEVFSKILSSWISTKPNRNVNHLCEVLKTIKCYDVAGELQNKFDLAHFIGDTEPDAQEPQPCLAKGTGPRDFGKPGKKMEWPVCLIPHLNKSIVKGRVDKIANLMELFNARDEQSMKNNVVLLHGIAGSGKAEVCKQLGYEINDFKLLQQVTRNKSSCFWLHGETSVTIRNSVLNLAVHLGYKIQADFSFQAYFRDILKLFTEKQKSRTRILIIIDNLNAEYSEAINIVEIVKPKPECFLVITSENNSVLQNIITSKVSLGKLQTSEAKTLLQKSSKPVQFTDEETATIFDILLNWPLGLQLAASYLKQQSNEFKNNVSNFIAILDETNEELKDKTFEPEYLKTICVMCNITAKQLRSTALKLLNILAHLQPDTINVAFLKTIYRQICPDVFKLRNYDDFTLSLNELFDYSLVTNYVITKNTSYISIHRLVQEAARLNANNQTDGKTLFDIALLCGTKLRQVECSWITMNIQQHLDSLAKLAFPSQVIPNTFDNSISVLTFLLNAERIDCALQYTKLVFPNIEFSSDTPAQKILLEKLLLWNIVCGSGVVNNQMVQTGDYDTQYFHIDSNSLNLALKIAKTRFAEKPEMSIKVKNKTARLLYFEGKYLDLNERKHFNAIVSICEEIINSNKPKQLGEVYETLIFVGQSLKSNGRYRQMNQLLGLLTSSNLTKYFRTDLALSSKELLVFNSNFKTFSKLFRTIDCYYSNTNQSDKQKNFQSLKATDAKNNTKALIETEFIKLNYFECEISVLNGIIRFYEDVLTPNHKLTVRVKNVKVTKLLCNVNLTTYYKNVCISLCKEALHSPVDSEYKVAFSNLLAVKGIPTNDFLSQKVGLERMFKLKTKDSYATPSNLMKIKELQAEACEKLGDLDPALTLFKEVRDFATNETLGFENNQNINIANVLRVQLRLACKQGKYFPYKTRDDIYREFRTFKEYEQLTLQELENLLPIFTRILGSYDQLTLKVKNSKAYKLFLEREYEESSKLFTEVIVADDSIEREGAYRLLQRISQHLELNRDFQKSTEWVRTLLRGRIKSI